MKLSLLGLACLLMVTTKQDLQTDREPVGALRQRCVTAMQQDAASAIEECRQYVARSASDDPSHAKVVIDWFAAYKRVQPYIAALLNLPRDPDSQWLVYEPDLSLSIPEVAEPDGDHSAELKRSFADPFEDSLLTRAEAVYETPNKMVNTILRDPRWLAENLPEQTEPLWWVDGNDNVRLTTVVTARAVLHYYELSLKLRENPNAVPGFKMYRTRLVYRASIERHRKYSHGKRLFSNVYVADLNLKWAHNCGGLCGMSFERNKVVVLSLSGEVLAMFLDAPVNSTVTVS
jgi:hypothetical protein